MTEEDKLLEEVTTADYKYGFVTDIDSDGALSGPNLDLLRKVSQSTQGSVIASGGVAKLSDLTDLRQMGIEGVVLGKALYVGAIDISKALDICYK